MAGVTRIHWFRKGLRLHDNSSLAQSLGSAQRLLPIYIFDKWHSDVNNVGHVRFQFIFESLKVLDAKLKACGVSTGLLVFKGNPLDLIPKLVKELNAHQLSFDPYEESEVNSRKIDRKIVAKIEDLHLPGFKLLTEESSHWMHSPKAYAKILDGQPIPLTMSGFKKLFNQVGDVPAPTPAIDKIPFDSDALEVLRQYNSNADDLDKHFALPDRVPLLEIEGRDVDIELKFPGGEDEGLARLKRTVIARKRWTREFSKPKTSPNSIEPATTVLSPYLNTGSLSIRLVWHETMAICKNSSNVEVTSLGGQYLWRELWLAIGHFTDSDISVMKGNPISRQIPWDDNEEYLKAWSEARTGFPFIDAIMTQLKREGWIHHLARHMVACFLTRGDLWISWEKGAAVFDRYLIDADWSVNSCNWMWLSCSAFFHQYFRCYSPIAFGRKTDPEGEYIKKYIPQLKNYPKKYIYEPWKAPKASQKEWGCIVGRDYPKPIIKDHTSRSKENMARMKEAFNLEKKRASGDTNRNEKKLKQRKLNFKK